MKTLIASLLLCLSATLAAQTDTTARRFCKQRIEGLSPQRIVSLGYDAYLPYTMAFSPVGEYPPDADEVPVNERADAAYTGGFRAALTLPVYNKDNGTFAINLNYRNTIYNLENVEAPASGPTLTGALSENGLQVAGAGFTFFKPLNTKHYVQGQYLTELGGDYRWKNPQSLQYLRHSAAVMWGKKVHDRLQWGLGISSTYRAGSAAVFPVVQFNWTSAHSPWGVEILLPARAQVRYNFSPNHLLLAGFELEGASSRIGRFSTDEHSFEIRRSELRPRLEYMQKIWKDIWISAAAGWRYNWRFHGDILPDGTDFWRNLGSDKPYAMYNELGNPLFFQVGMHYVAF
jgi:hypothetical protein